MGSTEQLWISSCFHNNAHWSVFKRIDRCTRSNHLFLGQPWTEKSLQEIVRYQWNNHYWFELKRWKGSNIELNVTSTRRNRHRKNLNNVNMVASIQIQFIFFLKSCIWNVTFHFAALQWLQYVLFHYKALIKYIYIYNLLL